MKDLQNTQLLQNISSLLDNARRKVAVAVNQTIVLTYYEIGRMIVEDEQNGENRAEYGKAVLKDLSLHLTEKFGKGFSVENLDRMRFFYKTYSEQISSTLLTNSSNIIQQTTSVNFNLSWSHYLKLMRIKDINERKFYEIESYKNNWSLRELQRQYDSALYTRLFLSKNKEEILQLAEKGQIVEKPKDLIKDPYVLEFLGLSEKPNYSESDLESGLIDKLEHFLLELGNGFTFVGRQQRITFEEKHFYINLVFYNRILRCFVLIDLKIGELKHQDIGQMQMYVNYFDREKLLEGENKTIGIILCQDKSEALVQYTLPEDNEQIFASKYFTVLPSKQDFINILNSDNGKTS
ncbi:YhcG family protein [Chryseobacterium sp. CCH4-E10]|jgi:predicted nuclease of restriction endonuclease-like (RecB) superfamily|uniref:PDDEXK nuclease domain-containing protein n=1 Tax=Chryseobacterium sp. CCH4-E10 TaxID=1768758 RepID=UPI00082D1D37|nr:PDDEXK nuclease domain-containing protein [Chryseobacterium sp. CCH4-E10]